MEEELPVAKTLSIVLLLIVACIAGLIAFVIVAMASPMIFVATYLQARRAEPRKAGYARLAAIAFCILVLPASAQSVSVDVDLSPLIARLMRKSAPKVTCGIETVGYRFIGEPGREFVYAGETFVMDADAVELIADKRRGTFAIDGRSIRIDSPRDQFGFREATLPEGALPKVRARR